MSPTLIFGVILQLCILTDSSPPYPPPREAADLALPCGATGSLEDKDNVAIKSPRQTCMRSLTTIESVVLVLALTTLKLVSTNNQWGTAPLVLF